LNEFDDTFKFCGNVARIISSPARQIKKTCKKKNIIDFSPKNLRLLQKNSFEVRSTELQWVLKDLNAEKQLKLK